MKADHRAKTTGALLSVVLAIMLVGIGGAAGQASAAKSDEQQLRDLLGSYAKSVDTLDVELAARIWSHNPEVSFIHPRGTENGFQQIRDNFYKKAMGTFSERELILENPAVHIYGDTAWSQMTWTFHATVKDGGPKITTTGRETQIYHKEDGAWRILHVHYSGPPMTGALKGF